MTADFRPDLVVASWERIEPAGELVAKNFYARLFLVHRELRGKFGPSMARQNRHLLLAVDTVARAAHDLDAAVPEIQRLGRTHAHRAQPEHYPMVGGALLATLQAFDRPNWVDELAESWATGIQFVAGVMIDAAEEALTTPGQLDLTPRWYDVADRRTDGRTSRLWLTPAAEPAAKAPVYSISPLGRPGMWQSLTPATDVDLPGRYGLVVDVAIIDWTSRALGLLRPGQRVAVAPEVH